MRLFLTEEQARALLRHAIETAPQEACGLLAGVGEQVQAVIPIANSAADPRHFYRLDDTAFARALLQLDRQGLDLVALYHSHPHGDPIPSPTDVQQATYPDTPYLIIGLRGEPRLAVWQMRYGEVTPVKVIIGVTSDGSRNDDGTLSQAQRLAIIVSAILAFAFMIIVSLVLLPPAPVIVVP